MKCWKQRWGRASEQETSRIFAWNITRRKPISCKLATRDCGRSRPDRSTTRRRRARDLPTGKNDTKIAMLGAKEEIRAAGSGTRWHWQRGADSRRYRSSHNMEDTKPWCHCVPAAKAQRRHTPPCRPIRGCKSVARRLGQRPSGVMRHGLTEALKPQKNLDPSQIRIGVEQVAKHKTKVWDATEQHFLVTQERHVLVHEAL